MVRVEPTTDSVAVPISSDVNTRDDGNILRGGSRDDSILVSISPSMKASSIASSLSLPNSKRKGEQLVTNRTDLPADSVIVPMNPDTRDEDDDLNKRGSPDVQSNPSNPPSKKASSNVSSQSLQKPKRPEVPDHPEVPNAFESHPVKADTAMTEVMDDAVLKELRKLFTSYSEKDHKIDINSFREIMGFESKAFSERLFSLFKKDPQSQYLDLNDFLKGLRSAMYGSKKQKLQFIFNLYDSAGHGYLEPQDLKLLLIIGLQNAAITLNESLIEVLVLHLFDKVDINKDGKITFDEFWQEAKNYPDLLDNVTIRPKQFFHLEKPVHRPEMERPPAEWLRQLLKERSGRLGAVVYLFANLICFLVGFREHNNALIVIARGTGYMALLNLVLSVALTLRHVFDAARYYFLSPFRVMDYHYLLHSAVSVVAVFLAIIHSAVRIASIDSDRREMGDTDGVPIEYWEYLVTTKDRVGWLITGTAYPTGLGLLLGIIVICVFSLPIYRTRKHFWVFYLGHSVCVLLFGLAIFHSLLLFIFSVVLLMLYLVNKVLPFLLGKRGRFQFLMSKATILPSKVLQLHIERPEGHSFFPGDYIYVCIPDVSYFEWHPFCISSPPHIQSELWLHIRVCGAWTDAVYEYVLAQPETGCPFIVRPKKGTKEAPGQAILREYQKKLCARILNVPILVDGPYTTPGLAKFNQVEHAVVIALEHWVTSVASVLQHIEKQFNSDNKENLLPKRVDFIWLNNTQKTFEWFLNLLLHLGGSSQHRDIYTLRLHIYLSSAHELRDIRGFGLQMALYSMYVSGERDVITGLNTLIKPGLPDWNQIFDEIQDSNQGLIHVFFTRNFTGDSGSEILNQCKKRKLNFTRV